MVSTPSQSTTCHDGVYLVGGSVRDICSASRTSTFDIVV
jgi:hypothetical protein